VLIGLVDRDLGLQALKQVKDPDEAIIAGDAAAHAGQMVLGDEARTARPMPAFKASW
jgi:hypothetical protein